MTDVFSKLFHYFLQCMTYTPFYWYYYTMLHLTVDFLTLFLQQKKPHEQVVKVNVHSVKRITMIFVVYLITLPGATGKHLISVQGKDFSLILNSRTIIELFQNQ